VSVIDLLAVDAAYKNKEFKLKLLLLLLEFPLVMSIYFTAILPIDNRLFVFLVLFLLATL
jgi:hypothetical protein